MRGTRVISHEVSRGAWLLLRAGVPVSPWQEGTVYDPRYPVEVEGDAVRIRLVTLDPEGETGRDYLGAAVCEVPVGEVGGPEAIPDSEIEVVRASVLAEIERIRITRTQAHTVDGVPYGIGPEARDLWGSLLHRIALAEAGVAPMTWPTPFRTYDGSLVLLTSPLHARTLWCALFDSGVARHSEAVAASLAVMASPTVDDVVAALMAYRSLGV